MDDGVAIAFIVMAVPIILLTGLVSMLVLSNAYMLLGGVSLLLIVLGAVMLTGRGSGIVAGINHMSAAERTGYDLPRLSRAMGAFLLSWSVLPVAIAIGTTAVGVSLAIGIAVTAWTLWYCNTRCRIPSRS